MPAVIPTPTAPKLILASTSKYRKQLLEQLNVDFLAVAPLAAEEALKKSSPVSLRDLPLYLAQKKAESLIAQYPQAIIIGSDQMGVVDGVSSGSAGLIALNKAGTRQKAIEQLTSIAGRSHELITAMSVYAQGQWHHHVDTTTLRMRPLSKEQITRYVDLENPIDCAGSYKMESLGISLFEAVQTKDHTAIVGLPLIALCRILNSLGIAIP